MKYLHSQTSFYFLSPPFNCPCVCLLVHVCLHFRPQSCLSVSLHILPPACLLVHVCLHFLNPACLLVHVCLHFRPQSCLSVSPYMSLFSANPLRSSPKTRVTSRGMRTRTRIQTKTRTMREIYLIANADTVAAVGKSRAATFPAHHF